MWQKRITVQNFYETVSFFRIYVFSVHPNRLDLCPKELDVFVYGKNGVLFLLIFLLPKSVPLEELQMSYTKIYLFFFLQKISDICAVCFSFFLHPLVS